MLMPNMLRPMFQTIINPTIATSTTGGGFNGYGIVQSFALGGLSVAKTGGRVRVTFKPPAGGSVSTVIASAYVGMAATAPSFDGNQVQLLRESDGSTGFTLTAGGSDVPTIATFRPTLGGALLVAFGITSGDIIRNLTLTSDYVTFYNSTDNTQTASTSKTGYITTSTTTSCWCVSKIEVLN